MIDQDITQEILHQLFSSLEALETQSTAILQFLKEKGIASEEELAIHLEHAGNASSVRWRAARVRTDHLLSSAIKAAAQEAPKAEQQKSSEDKEEPSVKATKKTSRKHMETSAKAGSEKETQAKEKVAARGQSEISEEQQINTDANNRRS